MIIWLASYPRSGNTLLRTVLFQCFGVETYNMDRPSVPTDPTMSSLSQFKNIMGTKNYEDVDWGTFYRRASISDSKFPIKTHTHPTDKHPAIYVVRDGRSASLSYLNYHQTRHPEAKRTLNQIICGDDVYGSWSNHYHAWNTRGNGRVLLLYFEELVHSDRSTLERIADFIGYTGPIKPWENPRDELNAIAPWFFREGATSWQPKTPWNEHYDRLFYAMHGELMQKLNFYTKEEKLKFQKDSIANGYAQLTDTISSMVSKNNELQRVCDERLGVITALTRGYLGRLCRYAAWFKRRLGSKQV